MSRFLLYSHDAYGLGHVRRSGLLAAALVDADPEHEVLIATGSPHSPAIQLPERVDSVTLPAVTKDAAGTYQPRKLTGGIERLIALRSSLLLATVDAYEPDVIVVDHAPLGMAGELLPLLARLDQCHPRPRLVLGLRDIIDAADRVEDSWHRDGTWRWLDRYDDIFVYGDPRILTTATELDLASRVAASITHTGFVAPQMPAAVSVEPYLLVTPGGGGDGHAMLRRYLDAVEAGATDGMRSVVATGPLMSSADRAELIARAGRLRSVELMESSTDMRGLIASATGVVSMAGYNTVVEEIAAGVPALLVPRRTPRLEQDIRANRLVPHTALERCSLPEVTTRRLARFTSTCRERSRHPQPASTIDLRGATAVAAALVGSGPGATATPHANRASAHA